MLTSLIVNILKHLPFLTFLVIFVICEIDFHLSINKFDHTVNDIIGGHSKVLWRTVVGVDHSLNCLEQQRLRPGGVLHEVEDEDVVEVTTNLLLIVEIGAIMKFSKFEYYFDRFWLVFSRKASMLFAVENSFTAFIDQMWANGVLSLVEGLVKVLLLG